MAESVSHPGSNPRRHINTWLIGVIGSVCGFALSQWIASYEFYKTLETTKTIEMVNLARELNGEFYSEKDGESIYHRIRTAIESCETLYASNGGTFGHDAINRYLGFFDDIGFYNERGALDDGIIDQMFGTYIVQAYQYAELKKYVGDLQKNEPKAFAEFQLLAQKLAQRPDQVKATELYSYPCNAKKDKATK